LRIDYFSPTLYLTDILIIGILISWGIGKIKNTSQKSKTIFILSLLFLSLNCFLAQSRGVAFFKLLKLLEFFLLGLYVAQTPNSLSFIRRLLPFSVIYSSLIALFQFLGKKTLGGFFWWLGERTFSLATPGIAKAALSGRLFLRAYSLFPHPNVLGGFLLVSLILINSRRRRGVWAWLSLILGLIAIFLTFSKVVWFTTGLILAFVWLKSRKKRNFFVIGLALISFSALLKLSLSAWDPLSLFRRLELMSTSLLMIRSRPFLGVGLGNFLVKLPIFWQTKEAIRFFQPVHNIFLLTIAEIGLFGSAFFFYFLAKTTLRTFLLKKGFLFLALLAIFFTGLFDHYWLTLQQTQLLFVLILGLSCQNQPASAN
jgi:hypothetical protein